MVARRALVLLLVTSFIVAGIPSRARAAQPTDAAAGVAEAFVNMLLRDAEVQQLLQAVVSRAYGVRSLLLLSRYLFDRC